MTSHSFAVLPLFYAKSPRLLSKGTDPQRSCLAQTAFDDGRSWLANAVMKSVGDELSTVHLKPLVAPRHRYQDPKHLQRLVQRILRQRLPSQSLRAVALDLQE